MRPENLPKRKAFNLPGHDWWPRQAFFTAIEATAPEVLAGLLDRVGPAFERYMAGFRESQSPDRSELNTALNAWAHEFGLAPKPPRRGQRVPEAESVYRWWLQ